MNADQAQMQPELGFDALPSLNLMKQLASSSDDRSSYDSEQNTFEKLESQLAKVNALREQLCPRL